MMSSSDVGQNSRTKCSCFLKAKTSTSCHTPRTVSYRQRYGTMRTYPQHIGVRQLLHELNLPDGGHVDTLLVPNKQDLLDRHHVSALGVNLPGERSTVSLLFHRTQQWR